MANTTDKDGVSEPEAYYEGNFRVFKSFAEQQQYELNLMASLKPEEILQQLRKLINSDYGMHGYDPSKLPQKHSIKIIKGGSE